MTDTSAKSTHDIQDKLAARRGEIGNGQGSPSATGISDAESQASKTIGRHPPNDDGPLAVGTPASDLFDDPDWSILDDRRGALPDFPVEVLTSDCREWLQRASRSAGVSPDHVIVPLLGVASSMIGTARRVRPSQGWSEPLTLWTCVVAGSGGSKTPGFRISLRGLDRIEKASEKEVENARLLHLTRAQEHHEVKKRWQADRRAAIKGMREPPSMPSEARDPGEFVAPRLYATDPSVASITPLLNGRPRGMLLIRDELSGLFAVTGHQGKQDRAFWLQAYDGDRYVVERFKKSYAIDHLLVGITGGFQPDKLARAFAGAQDGIYARFLYAWPSTPDYQPLSDDVSEVEPIFRRALECLIKLPSDDTDGTFTPKDVRLSDAARGKFEGFRLYANDTMRGLDGREDEWFAKGQTHVLRLAGTLAYLAWAFRSSSSAGNLEGITDALEPTEIDETFITAAIQLWRGYFWPHARAALRQIEGSDHYRHERRVLRWIRKNNKTEISREEIRRGCLGQCIDANETQKVLDALGRGGWLHLKTTITGGRSKHRFKVNPKLFEAISGTA